MTVQSNKYNSQTHTFVSEPLIKGTWNELAKDSAGTPGVTLGVDDWYPTAIDALRFRRPLFNRLGAGSTSDLVCYFFTNDRIYLHDISIYCNFADGLVRQSDIDVTPAPFTLPVAGTGDPVDTLPNYEIEHQLKVQIYTFYMQEDGTIISPGFQFFPVSHFNQVNNLGKFASENVSQILQTNVCQWLEVNLFGDAENTDAHYSTININPDFQDSEVLVWAEATISSTFGTRDHDDVIASLP